jgi:hypothetical protein
VLGNLIGTDVTGTVALKNTDVGVLIDGAPNNAIGGSLASARNVISGNGTDGVRISGSAAADNVVQGNLIGVTASGAAALPNGANGVRVTNDAEGSAIGDPSNDLIGGAGAGEANVIASNALAGAAVVRGTGIAIIANSIYGNGTLGIDLGADGVTIDDGAKNGGLPNASMDYPVITSQVLVGNTLTLAGYVGSVAGQSAFANTRVDFFRSDQDASGYGEGKTFLGTLTTGSNGNFSGSIDVTGIGLASGNRITAAATDTTGNTSEFGPNVLLLASISGTVFEDVGYGGGAGRDRAAAAGVGRASARVELYDGTGAYVTAVTTDAAGRYTFPALVNDNYTVRVVNSTCRRRARATSQAPISRADVPHRRHERHGPRCHRRVGGQFPASADGPNGKGGAVLNRTTSTFTAGVTGIASRSTTVSLTGSDVAGVDFGYSFDCDREHEQLRRRQLAAVPDQRERARQRGPRPGGAASPARTMPVFMLATAPRIRASAPRIPASSCRASPSIAPASALPTITDPVAIDARTQPGWTGAPLVELNGSSAGASANGLAVTAGNSLIGGLAINRFRLNGIALSSAGGNVVAGNHVGLNAAGISASANTQDGILVSGSPGNRIGGTAAEDRNVISGNGWVGIEVLGAASLGTVIQGNYIGVNRAGTLAIPNLNDGIDVASGASNTTVGGTAPGAGNVISGKHTATMDGVWINLGSGNVVQGKLIGTNAAGTAGIPNARSECTS